MPRPHKLTRRTLPTPPAPSAPDSAAQLAHIAELSRNARTTWFGLLGLLAFVGVTLLGHQDAAFFAKGAATKLPLVGITVPVEAFFATAPVLVAAVYAYLHLYLMTLWDALAEAEPRIDDKPLTERVYPWLITYAALWYRNRRRSDGSAAPRALGLVVVAVSVFLGWVLGIVVMAGLWIRSMPAHDEFLTLWIGVCLWFAVQVGWTGFMTARARMAGAWRETVAAAHWSRRVFGVVFAGLLGVLSWETTEGGLIPHAENELPPLLVPANLAEAELTPRPKDWKPFELWLRDLRRARKKDGVETDPEQNPLIPTREEMERWALVIAALDAPELFRRDIRGARLFSAFLPGADLRRARLQNATLEGAELQGADLRQADMQATSFELAELQGTRFNQSLLDAANFAHVKLQGADLSAASISKANFYSAEIQAADFSFAKLPGANLEFAEMQGAVFYAAQLENSHFLMAKMQGANLNSANLTDANLERASLDGARLLNAQLGQANLRDSQLDAADLRRADLNDANCMDTSFLAALVGTANLTCKGMTREQQTHMVGDEGTRLYPGHSVRTCLDEDLSKEVLLQIDAAISHKPRRSTPFLMSAAEFRETVFCAASETPEWVGHHQEIDGVATPADPQE